MSKFTQGSLTFKKKLVKTIFDKRWNIEVYDCYPKLPGTVTRFNPFNKAHVEIDQKYLQPKERELLLEGSKQKTLKDLLQILSTNFSVRSLKADYSNIPSKWKNSEQCYKKTISIQTKYEVLEITCR
ncbi:MAG: hypothetical protein R8K20_01840, partial [Gallionellaceae bacterium]